MRALLTGVVATIEAIAVALASLLIVAAFAFLVWWLAFDLAAEPSAVFAGAGAAWLLAHFIPLSIDIPAEAMQLFGFGSDALNFTLSLAPLGITLVTVGFALRAGWRAAARGGPGGAAVLGGALGFGAIAGIVHSAAPMAIPGWFATACIGALVYGASSGVAFLVRAARDEHGWWVVALAALESGLAKLRVPRPAVLPHRAGQILRLAAMLLAAYTALAAITLAIGLFSRFAVIIAASEALQLDLWGTILIFVLQLALLPVLLLWSGAWLSGAGFAVGIGSSASPFGQLLGPMPGIPVLAAIPEGWGSAAVLAPLLLALAGIGIGIALGETAKRQTLARLAIQVLLATLLAGLAIALFNWASGGSMGPGRLAEVGPHVWTAAGLAAAELGIGCFLGALAARADIARRVVEAPAAVASRLGIGDDTGVETGSQAGDRAEDQAGAGAAASVAAGIAAGVEVGGDAVSEPGVGAGSTASAAQESAERLAPVTPFVPRTDPESTPWRAGAQGPRLETAHSRVPRAQVPDDQPTEPLDFDTDELEAAEWGDATPASAPLPTAPEPELFDQHEADDRGKTARRAAEGADTGKVHAREPEIPLDPESLVEAYSWDNAVLDPEPVEEPKRQGWRWPRRKG